MGKLLEDNYLIMNLIDVSERIAREREIEYLSYHDELTGLYNRRYFQNEMKRLDGSRRYPLSVIIGDLDNLKTVNDNSGHPMGDKYLKKSAEIIKNLLRAEDIIARIGGDEFAILLPETAENETEVICDRIRSKFKQVDLEKNFSTEFKISLGYATIHNSDISLETAYNMADQKMYQNKGRR